MALLGEGCRVSLFLVVDVYLLVVLGQGHVFFACLRVAFGVVVGWIHFNGSVEVLDCFLIFFLGVFCALDGVLVEVVISIGEVVVAPELVQAAGFFAGEPVVMFCLDCGV